MPETLIQSRNQLDPTLILSPAEARSDAMQDLHMSAVNLIDAAPLYGIEKVGIGNTGSYEVSVVGEIAIPNGTSENGKFDYLHAALLKIKNQRGETRFGLQGLTTGEDGSARTTGSRVVGIPTDGSAITLGRDDEFGMVDADKLWPGKTYADDVSRKQVSFSMSEGMVRVEDTSANGTKIRGNFVPADSSAGGPTHAFDHTTSAKEMARLRGKLDSQERFGGRPVVTRDTYPVDNVVDIRSWAAGAEALVVDSSHPEAKVQYDKLRDSMNKNLAEIVRAAGRHQATEQDVLLAIHRAVGQSMQYDLQYVNNFSNMMQKDASGNRKVNLSAYLEAGKGVCRQMALAAAWLGADAARSGLLQGRTTAEVNQRLSDNAAHEWARYTAPDGTVYILDPAQNSFGKLEDTLKRQRNVWEYFRPDERSVYEARNRNVARGVFEHDRGLLEFGEDGLIKVPDWVKKGLPNN